MRAFPLVASICLTSSIAVARDSAPLPPIPDDNTIKVWVNDGAFFRGEPLEIVPRDHVTLRLHDGKTMRIDWSKIAGVDGLKPVPVDRKPATSNLPLPPPKRRSGDDDDEVERAPSLRPQRTLEVPQSPQPSPGHTTESTPRLDERRQDTMVPPTPIISMDVAPGIKPVGVRFTGLNRGATVEYLAGLAEVDGVSWPMPMGDLRAETWRPICELPCRLLADPQRVYRLKGEKITQSATFVLPKRGDKFEVEIKPGWVRTRIAAIALIATGGALASVGAGIFASDFKASTTVGSTHFVGSVSLLSVGLLAVIVSGPLFGSSSTSVEIYRE